MQPVPGRRRCQVPDSGLPTGVVLDDPSGTSREDAAAEAIRTAAATIRDLRVAEVVKQDIHLDQDGAMTYRTKLQLSFKYENEH